MYVNSKGELCLYSTKISKSCYIVVKALGEKIRGQIKYKKQMGKKVKVLINEVHTDLEQIEDFIKVSAASNEISDRCAIELLRLNAELKERILDFNT